MLTVLRRSMRAGTPASTRVTAKAARAAALASSTRQGTVRLVRSPNRADAPEPEERLGDEELVHLARAGDDVALGNLIARYRGIARHRSRSYYLVGGDSEDVQQEAMIGLYKAIRDFDPGMEASFRTFADLCMTRQLISAVKGATRQKHGPLNGYVSFTRPVSTEDGDTRELGDLIPCLAESDPAELMVSAERIRALQECINSTLSHLESEVLRLYVSGKSYVEIADVLDSHTKAVDNALQRVKRKLEQSMRASSV
jgi:RNA polymerase sporulation-specific sigma factor